MTFKSASTNIYIQYTRRILLDCLLIPIAFYMAMFVIFEGNCSAEQVQQLSSHLISITILHILINLVSGIYHRLWAFADLRDAWHVLRAAVLATLLLWGAKQSLGVFADLHNGVIVMGGLFYALASSGVKYRRYLMPGLQSSGQTNSKKGPSSPPERVLIVGTNPIARQFTSQLSLNHQPTAFEVVGYIDDDQSMRGMTINGFQVLGTTAHIPKLVRKLAIDIVVIALEDASHDSLWQLIAQCQETDAQIKVLPDVTDLMDHQYEHPLTLREIRIEDLLRRRPLQMNEQLCRSIVRDKVVLVTGAAGSIGSELCRQLCGFEPNLLLILDNNESGLYNLNLELNHKFQIPILLLLADVADSKRINAIFNEYKPQIVYHAAAYKHVPLMETNPDQSLRVNIKGTMNVSQAAHDIGVERFVFISSDKAVHPSSVMGASKYVCELWLRSLNKQSSTMFTAVRFGNVVGSRGSVLPVFANQIDHGGPVTVTHKEMKRFFMSIPEAVNLVLEAAAFGDGGEVFMLDMGEEVRIQDLAERMIRLKGLRVHKDIPIRYIGIRPGEKLREALSYDVEQQQATLHPRIYCLQTDIHTPSLAQIQTAVSHIESHLTKTDASERVRQEIFNLATQPFDQLETSVMAGKTAVLDKPTLRPPNIKIVS